MRGLLVLMKQERAVSEPMPSATFLLKGGTLKLNYKYFCATLARIINNYKEKRFLLRLTKNGYFFIQEP